MEEVIKYGYVFFFILAVFLLIVPYFEEPVLTHGLRNSSMVALTFNEHPSEHTTVILELLAQRNVTATFFVTGNAILARNETYNLLVSHGHEIGIHGMGSDVRTWYEKRSARSTLSQTQALLHNRTGWSRPLHLFPSPVMKRAAQEEGLLIVGGDIVVLDGESELVAQRVLAHVKEGSIIIVEGGDLFTENILLSLPLIIESLEQRGWELVSLSTLFDKVGDG